MVVPAAAVEAKTEVPAPRVSEVELDVAEGGLTMLLGRNGAGKTTTLRTIMGLWQASQGRITFGGEDITQLNTPAIAQKNIAYVKRYWV